jgi:hypothetical protein
MKALNLIFAIIAVSFQPGFGQSYNSTSDTRFGFEINQFSSASGFKSGAEAHFTVRPSNRSQVGFGVYFDNQSQRITGVTISHKRMLRNYKRNSNPVVEPLFFYNFIYRKSNMAELLADGNTGSFVTYTSMEHHLGFGLNINVFSKISIQGQAGYGLYLGSIKKPSTPNPITHEITGSNGWGSIIKFGIGYHL